MIELDRLTKRFGPILAVQDVSLEVETGQVLGFLGPNGAGKSTTMRMATGFLPPTSGRARLAGHDVHEDPVRARARMGYLPEGAPLYPDMDPRGLLRFCARARGLRRREATQRVEAALDRVELTGVARQRIGTLSKGFRRRVGLAQAILHDPDVLILDEPTDGLDPNQKDQVRELIRGMAADKAIVLSTHILEEVESVCTRATILANGQLRFDGTPAELRRHSRNHGTIEVAVRGARASDAGPALEALASVDRVESMGTSEDVAAWRVVPAKGADAMPEVTRCLGTGNWDVVRLHLDTGRLDDVFRTITREAHAAATPNVAAGGHR